MHGKRATHTVAVSIMDKVEKLQELLAKVEPEEMGGYHTVKFVYPIGKLKALNLAKTFQEQNVPCGAQLVLLGQKNFTWDINRKGQNI